MQYIDIDSSFRNRNMFPNPASFDVLQQTTSSDAEQDAVSNDSIIFPDPQEIQPIGFFTETLQPPINTIAEINYLPFMYATPADTTVIQLDELPIYSTDSSTADIGFNTLYPRNSIPLGTGNEFYTGDTLEDVLNNEFRLVVSSVNETFTNNVFQNGSVLYVTTVGLEYFFYVSNTGLFQQKLSNIARFYQGKYILMTSGASEGQLRLVINYLPDVLSSTFQLQSPFGDGVTTEDSFSIVSDRKWYVTIDRPFTNAVPNYPAYRDSIYLNQLSFIKNVIYTSSSSINRLTLDNQVSQGDGIVSQYSQGVGLAFIQDNGTTASSLALGDAFYLQSSENVGYSWFLPVTVDTDVFVRSGVGLVNPGTNGEYSYPQRIYVQDDTFTYQPFSSIQQNPSAYFTVVPAATTPSGTAYSDVTPVDYSPNIYCATLRNWYELFPLVYPQLENFSFMVYADNQIDLKLFSDTYYTPVTLTIDTATTYITPLAVYIQNQRLVVMYVKDDGFYYVISSTVDGSAMAADAKILISNDANLYDYTIISRAFSFDIDEIETPLGSVLCFVFFDGNQLDMNIYDSDNSISYHVPINQTVYPTAPFLIVRVNQLLFKDILTTFIFYASSVGLWVVYNTDTADFGEWSNPISVDTSTIFDLDTIITNEGELLIVYSRLNQQNSTANEIVTLHLNPLNVEVGRPYRLRKNSPFLSDGQASLANITQNTVTLPSITPLMLTENLVNKFIHLRSTNTNQIQDTFYIFNFIAEINEYDSTSRELTFTPSLPFANPAIYTIPPIGATELFLSFENYLNVGEDFSGNDLDFTVLANTDFDISQSDVNGTTLDNVVSVGAGGGFTRDVSSDIQLAKTFILSPNNNFSSSFIAIPPATCSLSLWFQALAVSGTQSLLYYNGFNDAFYFTIKLIANALVVDWEQPSVNPTSDFTITAGTTILPLTWYNISVVLTPLANNNVDVSVYVNGVLDGSSLNQVMGLRLWFEYLWIGHNDGTEQFLGYMKNVIQTDVIWSEQQVNYVYHNALQTPAYTLEWEILGNIVEQWVPLDVITSRVNTQQHVCYEIELTHFILPNVILSTGVGNYLAFYPYVYVEFRPVNDTYGEVLFSNNPVGKRALFKVPITNIANPLQAKYVSNNAGMRQIVKFKPWDSFHFAVYLPNGELFTSQIQDNVSPFPPNAFLQVSATIGFRRH